MSDTELIESWVFIDFLTNPSTGKHAWTCGDGVLRGPFNTRRQSATPRDGSGRHMRIFP